ncbi:MAG: Fic family protein [Oscillospiraceae bacterium]|nr:Fic family protein [Oscillospiraceae bacterium]
MESAKEQAVSNAVASAEIEGLHPTEQDIARIRDFLDNRISHDELVAMAIYDISGTRADCYPNTTVLINRFHIQDQKKLSTVEQKLVTSLAAQLEAETVFEHVDFAYYKGLHKALFGDLYDWAGTVRTIPISKKGTVFCPAEEISGIAEARFLRLKQQNYLTGLDDKAFLEELTGLYDDLNLLHPFRDGNGRTLRLFITLLVKNTGRRALFGRCDANLLASAAIQAAQGKKDLLRQALSEVIVNG